MSCSVKPCLFFFTPPGEGINEIMVSVGDKVGQDKGEKKLDADVVME